MYIDYSTWEYREFVLNSLYLDLNNPRLKYRNTRLNQSEIMKFLIANEEVYELAKKISEEGYFVGKEPIICIENNKKIVLEGNRRTAALKLLHDPNKYLTKSKANILNLNILKNNFPINKKLRCFIAPNRLLANPLIYDMHRGESLKKWKTGNQYAFVADMYYDGLSIEDIAEVLNESKSKILKPLKAYNLFLEGKDLLEKEDNTIIDIDNFDFTNLERFYSHEKARKLLGIDFNVENGTLIINIPRDEFEKRLLVIFKIIIDSKAFSREFNTEDDKEKFINKLKNNYNFDFSVSLEKTEISKSIKQKADLEKEKEKITVIKKRRKKNTFFEKIIQPETEIYFNNEKLDTLFLELKSLSNDKYYSFALLLRTYLEQSLYFYLKKNDLLKNLSDKTNEKKLEESAKKVDVLINFLNNKHNFNLVEKDHEIIMNILRFNTSKDYSNASLKIMLDYIINYELNKFFDTQQLKNLKKYLTGIKDELDLAVHNIETFIDLSHNKRAWNHLEPLFVTLSNNINTEE